MTLRDDVVRLLARLDDDAWVALANRGLLRRARKDLTTTHVALRHEGDRVEVDVGSSADRHVVSFGSDGAVGATCTCPSRVTCQHLITAALWLVDTSRSTSTHAARADAPTNPSPLDDLGRNLLELELQDLEAHAGRAGVLWAVQHLTDLEPGVDWRVEEGPPVVVRFTSPRVTFRYVGGGLGAFVADTRLPRHERHEVAAVLAYQRSHGSPAPDVGPTAAPPVRVELASSRSRVRATAQHLLVDSIRLGLSHLSPSMHERYETLAVWAQGADYPRLALLLRRLSDHVELILARSTQADESRLLDDTALAYALVEALEQADRAGQSPVALVGRARTRYDRVRSLEVIGLGARGWRTPSGYRGLTAMFWWPDESRFLSWTDARPESAMRFDPAVRHDSPGPWSGLTSPRAATGARVRLTEARVSSAGRVSGVESTYAALEPLGGPAVASALSATSRWADLPAASGGFRSLLDAPKPLQDWVVLAPSSLGPASFDPLTQTMRCPVVDVDGAALDLVLSYSEDTAGAVESLEELAGETSAPWLVVARLHASGSGLVAEPLSVVDLEAPGLDSLGAAGAAGAMARVAVRSLAFSPLAAAAIPRGGRARSGSADAGSADAGSAETAAAPTVDPDDVPAGDGLLEIAVPRVLRDLRSWHVALGERGTGRRDATLLAELGRRHRDLHDAGFDVFAMPDSRAPAERALDDRALRAGGDGASDAAVALLRSHFVLMELTAALTH